MKKALLRPAMIVLPLALGLFIPQAAGLSFLIRWVLIGMLFMVGLQLDLRQLSFHPCHWKLLVSNIAVGVVGYLVFHFAGNEQLALAAFFTGITPTATAAPVVMGFLNGRVAFVVTGFIVTNVGVSLALLPLIPIVTGKLSFSFAGDVAKNLFIIMVIPFALSAAVRKIHPAAAKWPGQCRMLSLSAWSFLLFIIAAGTGKFLHENAGISVSVIVEIGGVSAIICAVNFLLGALIAPRRFRRESSQTLGQKNTMLTLYLAMAFANPLAALGPTFYVICHNAWNACQLFICDRRKFIRAEMRSSGGAARGY